MNCKEVLSSFRLHGESQKAYDVPRVKRGREMWETERSCFEEGGGDKQLRSERVPSSGNTIISGDKTETRFSVLVCESAPQVFSTGPTAGTPGPPSDHKATQGSNVTSF